MTTSIIEKGPIGKEDIYGWEGVAAKTFTREDSVSRILTLNKVDWVGVDALQVYGGGVNADDTTLAAALTAIGTSRKVQLWLAPTTWTISNNLDASAYANVTWVIPNGALLSVASGKTLTLYSPENIIAQPNQQIFSEAWRVRFSNGGNPGWGWYGAKGDGVTGDSAAIQAIADTLTSVGGDILFPARHFLLDDQIVIPYGVGFIGSGKFRHQYIEDPDIYGTRFEIGFGTETATSLLYCNKQGISIENIEFFYTGHAAPGPGWAPDTTPWAIHAYRQTNPNTNIGGDGTRIRNIRLNGLSHGIKAEGCWVDIADVWGTCFNVGFDIDGSYDVTKLDDVHFNSYWWEADADVNTYINANFEFLRLGRVDNAYFSRIFAYGGRAFITVRTSTNVTPNGTVSLLSVSQYGADNFTVGLELISAAMTGSFSNGYFANNVAVASQGLTSDAGSAGYDLNFSAHRFVSSGARAIYLLGIGIVRFDEACQIKQYNYLNANYTAIKTVAGVQMFGCPKCDDNTGRDASVDTSIYRGTLLEGDGRIIVPRRENVVYNGSFDLWSRDVTFTSITNTERAADGWQFVATNAGDQTVSRSTSVPDADVTYSLQLNVDTADAAVAAGDFAAVRHNIEGLELQALRPGSSDAGYFYIEFSVWSSVTGVYTVALRNAAANRTYLLEYVVGAAETWEKKAFIVRADTTGTWAVDTTAGLVLDFTLMAGSTLYSANANQWVAGAYFGSEEQVNLYATQNNKWRIAKLKVSIGGVVNPFTRDNYQAEAAHAKRYVQALPLHVPDTTPALVTFPPMRAAPTFTGGGAGFSATNIKVGAANIVQTTAADQTLVLTSEL